MDIAIGVMFALDMGLAVLFIGMLKEYTVEAWSLIFGDVLGVTFEELVLMLISILIVNSIMILLYKEFKFVTFDYEGAVANGIHARMAHYLMMFIIALTIVTVLKSVGALLVFALTVGPPFAAYELTHNMDYMIIASSAIGMISGLTGFLLALYADLPASAVIALVATGIASISLLISPRRRKCCRVLIGRVRMLKEKRP